MSPQVLKHMENFHCETLDNAKRAVVQVLADLEEDFARQQVSSGPQQTTVSAVTLKVDLKAPLIKIPSMKIKDQEGSGFKYTVIAAQRSLHQRLHNFMRMSDYIVFSTLLDLVVHSVEGLCHRFRPGEVSVMFLAELRYTAEAGLHHYPADLEFSTEVEGIANSFVLTAGTGKRLLNHEEIMPMIYLAEPDSHVDEGILHMMVTQDNKYLSLIVELQVLCRREFVRCQQACVDFRPMIDMVVENTAFDIDALEAEAERTRSDFADFSAMIAEYREQVEEVKAIPAYRDYGVVRITLDAFKMHVVPSPTTCLSQLCELLPRILMRRLHSLHDELSDFNTGLSRSPRNVDEFVVYVLYIDKVEERQDAIDSEVSQLEEEFHQMDQAKIQLKKDDSQAYRMLFPELMAVRTAVDMAGAQRESMTAKWSKRLDEEVAAFKLQVKDIKMLVDTPEILDDPEDEILDRIHERLDETQDTQYQVQSLEEQGEKLKMYQKALKRPVDSFPDLARSAVDIRLKLGVWETFAHMEFEKKNWKELELSDVVALKVPPLPLAFPLPRPPCFPFPWGEGQSSIGDHRLVGKLPP